MSIERTSIHAVELDRHVRAIKTAGTNIPPDTFVNGLLSRRDVFQENVKKLLAEGKFSTPYVTVCFPEVFAYTRGCSLPLIPVNEVQEAITWRSKELFPFPEEDIYFDSKILDKTDKEYRMIVVAVQKKLLDQLVAPLLELGLKPLRFEPDASALVRLLNIGQNQHALLVEVNPVGAYITLVEGEKAVFTTVINNTPEDTPATYLSNIDQTLSDIAIFYRNKGLLQESSTQVFVTGEMSSEEWTVHLKQILKYPVKLLASPVPRQNFNKAYAAAVQKIAPPVDVYSINLLPTEMQSDYDAERNILFYKTLMFRFCLIAFIICLVSAGAYVIAAVRRQQTDNLVKSIRKMTQSQQGNTQALLLLNAQAKNVVALSSLRITPARKIESLTGLLNDQINISQWEYDDAKLSYKITGSAQTRGALLDFKDALDNSADFANVTLPLESLQSPVNIPFVITFIAKK
jgi:hypothetical protein